MGKLEGNLPGTSKTNITEMGHLFETVLGISFKNYNDFVYEFVLNL